MEKSNSTQKQDDLSHLGHHEQASIGLPVGCVGPLASTAFLVLVGVSGQTWSIFWQTFTERKNKMKPTNPNADTYVEKQRLNTYLSQFPVNPFVEHPDLTHWGDTLVGHPCLTLLHYALVRHSCMTLWFDTLAGHSCLTLFEDTLTWHSCKTLLAWHSYLPFL